MSSRSAHTVAVVNALKGYCEGRHRDLELILRRLEAADCKNSEMAEVFTEFKNHISILTRDGFQNVITAILKLDWTNKPDDVVRAYHGFIVNLVSAHSIYVQGVLSALVEKFSYKDRSDPLTNNSSAAEVSIEKREEFEKEMRHVHNTIMSVMKAVPLSVNILPKVIAAGFPYPGHKYAIVLETFVQNVLHMTLYCPSMRQTILFNVVDKLIFLDVRASREKLEALFEDSDSDEDEEDDDGDIVIFDMEGDTIKEVRPANKTVEADRLDSLMCVVFNYIDMVCRESDGNVNWEASKQLYMQFLSIFDKNILPTHESCHVQYIMFYICSLKQNLCEGFLDYLWKRVKNPSEHQYYRRAAVYYMSSFIARAKFISIRTAADAITMMCEWLHQYIGNAHVNVMQCDLQHHGAFYSVAQSVFYLLAFRQKEFLDMPYSQSFFSNLGLQNIVTCKLNPLRICQPAITSTFSAFVRKHQLAFCDSIIERNNRMIVPTANLSEAGAVHLQNCFPFDPYLLSRSECKIAPLYRTFDGQPVVPIVDTHAQKEEEGDDDFIGDDVIGTSIPRSPLEVIMGSPSPGFHNHQFIPR